MGLYTAAYRAAEIRGTQTSFANNVDSRKRTRKISCSAPIAMSPLKSVSVILDGFLTSGPFNPSSKTRDTIQTVSRDTRKAHRWAYDLIGDQKLEDVVGSLAMGRMLYGNEYWHWLAGLHKLLADGIKSPALEALTTLCICDPSDDGIEVMSEDGKWEGFTAMTVHDTAKATDLQKFAAASFSRRVDLVCDACGKKVGKGDAEARSCVFAINSVAVCYRHAMLMHILELDKKSQDEHIALAAAIEPELLEKLRNGHVTV